MTWMQGLYCERCEGAISGAVRCAALPPPEHASNMLEQSTNYLTTLDLSLGGPAAAR